MSKYVIESSDTFKPDELICLVHADKKMAMATVLAPDHNLCTVSHLRPTLPEHLGENVTMMIGDEVYTVPLDTSLAEHLSLAGFCLGGKD